jgi:lipopolysaccharide export system protein LptA
MDRRPPLFRLALHGLAAGALAGGAVALAFGSQAGAQGIAGFNSDQPVNYAADRIELQDKQNRVILSGNVVVNQGDLRLTAARATVAYTNNNGVQIQRMDATGGVVVTRGNERASGAAGVYDFNRRVIVLSGGVHLLRGTDTLNGGRLTMDLKSGLSTVDGGGGPAPGTSSSSGRVSGTFTVPKQQQQPTQTQAQPKKK